jgi:hypothetical protein
MTVMKTKIFLILALGLLFYASSSCKKEEFPDRETLVGKWVVKDGPPTVYVEFGMWDMHIADGNGTLHYDYSLLNSTMYLYPDKEHNPDEFTTHAIYYTKKTEELRIRNILKEYDDDEDGFTWFKRQ